jgi:glycerol-3-phosphate dehydrogenase (NAD(P)+)
MKVAVLGAGAWGSALAKLLSESGVEVTLWTHHPARLEEIARTRRNDRYLPGIELPHDWRLEPDLCLAIREKDLLIIAVPSEAVRSLTQNLAAFEGPIISVTKGVEYETGLTMSGVLKSTMPRVTVAALSGPSFALEVAQGMPTAIVAASSDPATALQTQALLHRPAFRVYTSEDILGVELGGALKNVVAIAAGVCDGLGFGDNTKAALITRGIAEIRRLGVACGAQAETFSGLSGLGDLTVTCFSRLSRNRLFGERIGRGESVASLLSEKTKLVEGFPTTRSAYHLAQKVGIDTPIINQVYAMLHEGIAPLQAVQELTARDSKAED